MPYIVIFESDDPIVRAKVTSALKGMGEWTELSSQSYLVDAAHSVSDLMETLQPMIGPADSLWVFTPKAPWSGYGDPIVDDHLHGHLGDADDYIPKDRNEATRSRS
jgi:hypothetical protein